MDLKYSEYNITGEITKDISYLFNIKTGAYVLLNLQENPNVRYLLEGKQVESLSLEMIKKLEHFGFLVDKNCQEFQQYIRDNNKKRDEDHGLFLTIIPTFSCNLNCIYCYEKKTKNIMGVNVQKKIIDLIAKKYETGKVKKPLKIYWFGGEPLIAFNIIMRINEQIQKLSIKYNFSYSSEIITNGYYLNKLSSKVIQELRLTKITVSMDGLENVTNLRRPHINNENYFSKVIDNIKILLTYFNNFSIKITIDKTNFDTIKDFLIYLKINNILDKCKYEFNYYSCSVGIKNKSCKEMAISEIMEFEDNLYKELKPFGIKESINLPSARIFDCMAHYKNSFIINPEGFITKCQPDASITDKSIGNVLNEQKEKYQLDNETSYFKFISSQPSFDECKACKYYPICVGYCIGNCAQKNWSFSYDICTKNKQLLESKLIRLAKERIFK